jgi:predicted RNase H-like nuclease
MVMAIFSPRGAPHVYRRDAKRATLCQDGQKMTGKSAVDAWVAGVDGCPGGWLVAFMRAAASEVRLRIVPRFMEVLAAAENAAVIAIDIPIGLPARAGPGGRAPERLVRPLLGERQSSVFSVPSRAALAATDYREACALALATSDPPRKISKQLFMIAPKIREVDQSLRVNPQASERVFEVHPELAFWRLNTDRALDEPKKVEGRCHERGLAVRRRLLVAAGFPESVVQADPPKGAGEDDLLDALACAAIAQRIAEGRARPFPDPPERDEHGLRIAIWA